MKIHYPSVDEALACLHSKREGLSATEAARRLQEYVENRIERLACVPLWRCLLASLEALLLQQVNLLREEIRARLPITQVMPGDSHTEFAKIARLSLLDEGCK